MFTRAIFLIGFLVVAGALAIGALATDGDDPDTAATSQPPASALDDAPPTVEAVLEQPEPTATPIPTRPPPTATSPARPTRQPTEPPAMETPAPSATASASPSRVDFTGVWTVLYTITEGQGAGQSYSFDVSLQQRGNAISGGNDGIRVDGRAEGQTATLTYRQPELGYTATFTWTLVNGAWGGGGFRSAVNSGTSLLLRVR
jgi:hypothetical protein